MTDLKKKGESYLFFGLKIFSYVKFLCKNQVIKINSSLLGLRNQICITDLILPSSIHVSILPIYMVSTLYLS